MYERGLTWCPLQIGERKYVKTDENNQSRSLPHASLYIFPVILATNNGAPLKSNHGSAKHHVMKVGYDKIGVVQVNVDRERSRNKPSPPDAKRK
jgi:hypothetical protein